MSTPDPQATPGAAGPTDLGPTRPTNVRWLVFVLGCGTSWLLYIHRYAFALVKSDIGREFNLDAGELANLDVWFQVFYGGVQIPAGILVDLVGAHLFLSISIAVWSVGLALHAFPPHYSLLLAGRILLASGQAAVFAALGWLTRKWFPPQVRTTVQGWLGVFFARFGGASTNFLIGTLLIGAIGLAWHNALLLLAALGSLLAFVFYTLVRNQPSDHRWANEAEAELVAAGQTEVNQQPVSVRDLAFSLFLIRSRGDALVTLNVLLLCLAAGMSTVADALYSSWLPYFLREVHGLEYKEMGIYSSLPLIGGALGGVLGGFVNDWAWRRRPGSRWVRAVIGCAGKGLAVGLLLLALTQYENPYTFCWLLFPVKIAADISLATRWGAITDIGARYTASLFAIVNAVAIVAGIIGAKLYGYLIPLDVSDAGQWKGVFYFVTGAYALCALFWLCVDSRKALDR